MSGVTAKQLVVHPGDRGQKKLDAVDTRISATPWDYADGRGTEPKILGTKLLLQVAAELARQEYRIVEIDMRDSAFQSLPDETNDSLEAELKELLTDARSAALAAYLILQNDVTLISITVRIPHSSQQLQINRDGEMRFRPEKSLPRFLEDVGRALGYERGF
jgi:hypothetical protein